MRAKINPYLLYGRARDQQGACQPGMVFDVKDPVLQRVWGNNLNTLVPDCTSMSSLSLLHTESLRSLNLRRILAEKGLLGWASNNSSTAIGSVSKLVCTGSSPAAYSSSMAANSVSMRSTLFWLCLGRNSTRTLFSSDTGISSCGTVSPILCCPDNALVWALIFRFFIFDFEIKIGKPGSLTV